MAISETKMQMVIANYFKSECNTDTSIRQAFEKGFRIGAKKCASMNRPQGEWIFVESKISDRKLKKCSVCGLGYVSLKPDNYCPNCGAKMMNDKGGK